MKIIDLKKSFSSFSLLVDDLNITTGNIYGVIGPNGCGKSTFLKLLAGLVNADRGHIDYNGLTSQDITMISRKPYFLHDSVIKNLIYPLTLRKINIDSEVLDEYLLLAGLIDKKKQYALSLSGGEQQKLALIRAVIFNPKLILLDEAFSNLDIESTSLFESYILNRQLKTPITWMIVSHHLSQIRRLCDRVLFMNNGIIEADDTTEKIFDSIENEKLRKYINYA
jgi:ABC-type multidrug transport system ATPase subunit